MVNLKFPYLQHYRTKHNNCLPNDFCIISIPKHESILCVSMVAPYFNLVLDETQCDIRKINFHNDNITESFY